MFAVAILAVYALQVATSAFGSVLSSPVVFDLGLFAARGSPPAPWTWITFEFVHASETHIFLNLLGLILISPTLEERIGSGRWAIVYFVGGAVGALVFLLVHFGVTVLLVGASAGIFAAFGAYARIYRRPGTHGSNRSSRPPVVLDAPGHYDGGSVGSRATVDGVGVSRGPQILFPFLAFEGEMAAPSALVLKCEACGAEVPHRVLRGKIGGRDEIVFEGTVKCPNCGRVSTVVTREPKPIEIPLIVSWLAKSQRTSLEFSPE